MPGPRRFAMPRLAAAAPLVLLIAGCGSPSTTDNAAANRSAPAAAAPAANEAAPPAANEAAPAAHAPAAAEPAAEGPAAPGTPGGLPDDRTPVAEGPFSEKSAQGAADVVQHYFALVEARRYAEARRLWDRGGDASGKTGADFAADFRRYRDYHAEVGAPGRMEGAAGSSYVEVPIQIYGHRADGSAFRQRATVTLRRVNDVPGSTEEQRRWHISDIAAGAAPE